jgi:hypothetical protein
MENTENVLSKSEILELSASAKNQINSLPYVPASKSCNSSPVNTPTKLYYETMKSLQRIKDLGIDTTEYVKSKLKYSSTLAVCKAFSAEQVDGIALAIYQVEEKNETFIIGDGTGVGKGRECAGLLRYAYHSSKIPMFLSKDTSLFNSIYRDIIDIGGFDESGSLPRPLIFNGCGSSAYNDELKKEVFENDIIVNGQILFRSIKKAEVLDIIRKKTMPNKYDIILSTYSIFSANLENPESGSAKNTKTIIDFLEAIQDSLFMLLDEAHQGAGKGSLNKNLKQLQQTRANFIFSSATFAKRYENLKFYIEKTAIKSSGVSEGNIELFVEEFKDNALEFISQGLAESGQFIRRELTLEGCDVDYKYETGKKEQQWERYDLLMNFLRKIIEFSKSSDYQEVVYREIQKVAAENKIELPATPMPKKEEELSAWKMVNKGKYVFLKSLGATIKNRNTWIESLLFSLKADFVAERTIDLLKNRINYKNTLPTGSVVDAYTNTKPLVTVRNTGESNIKLLDKKIGDSVSEKEMDFSYTLIKILQELIIGKVSFLKIDPDNERKNWKQIDLPFEVKVQNFISNGKAYNDLMDEIMASASGLPLSPLDYIIDKVSSAKREGWDYAFTKSDTFIIEDTSKRSSMLKKIDNIWYYVATKTENNSLKIDRFNNGRADAIIINVSASTGESFQSSFKFADTRKRSMLLHQVELDVTVEMQKLGRVNRTGQVNFPSYEYIISLIPSEVRRLMALRKKLRSLSAASTGNMNQASSYTEITDKEGKPLEDIFTKYGYDVLMTYLEQDPEILNYTKEQKEWVKKIIPAEEKLNDFCRQIEIAPCELQNSFYENVNRLYREKRIELMKTDEWDLDSDIINYKASIKNRAVLYQDSGENIFRSPVYLQDCYATPQSKPYSKQEVIEKMDFYAKGKKHNDFYEELCANLLKYNQKYFEEHLAKKVFSLVDEKGNPLEGAALKEVQEANENIKEEVELQVDNFLGWVYKIIAGGTIKGLSWSGLKIGKYCVVPQNEKAILDAYISYEAGNITEAEFNGKVNGVPQIYARFIGYKVDDLEGILNPSNISLFFAMLNGDRAEFRIKPTKQNRAILERFIVAKSNRLGESEFRELENWRVNVKPRIIIKTVTGNLLRAFDITEKIKSSEDKIKIGSYTTIDGGIEKGLIITKPYKYGESGESFEMKKYVPQFVPCNNDDVLVSYGTFHLSDGLSRIEGKELKIFFKDLNPKSTSKLNSIHASLIPQLKELAESLGVSYYFDTNVSTYTYKEGLQSRKSVTVNRFKLNYTKAVADYFYEQTKEVVEKGVKPLEYGKEDEYVLVEEKKVYSEEKGIYEYSPTAPFNESKKPPYFVSFEPSAIYPYGIVKTEYPLDELTLTSYQLVPINVNNEIAYKKLLARLNQLGKLESMISYVTNNKENYVGITLEAQKNTYYPMKYYFGDINMANIGRVIASFITKEEVPINVEEEEKYQSAMFVKTEIPLNMETAQDFLIKFNV